MRSAKNCNLSSAGVASHVQVSQQRGRSNSFTEARGSWEGYCKQRVKRWCSDFSLAEPWLTISHWPSFLMVSKRKSFFFLLVSTTWEVPRLPPDSNLMSCLCINLTSIYFLPCNKVFQCKNDLYVFYHKESWRCRRSICRPQAVLWPKWALSLFATSELKHLF